MTTGSADSTETLVAPRGEIGWAEITPPGKWFGLNLPELWRSRELLAFFVWRDVKVRYKQTLVGAAWAVLQPLATMAIFIVVFSRVAKLPTGPIPPAVFYLSGLVPWLYFSAALTNSANTIVEHQRVVTKVYFPRLILPMSGVLPAAVDFGISFVILLGTSLFMGVQFGWRVMLAPLFLLFAMVAALAGGVWLSGLNALYRDFRYALPFFVQLLFFASPVIVPTTFFEEKYRWILALNPMSGVISGFRWALTGVGAFPSDLVIIGLVVSFFILVSGLMFFSRLEDVIADVV